MEEGDDGALELETTADVHGSKREGLPDDGFADVGSDEEGDTKVETITFLEMLVEEDDDEGSGMSWMMSKRQIPAPRPEG